MIKLATLSVIAIGAAISLSRMGAFDSTEHLNEFRDGTNANVDSTTAARGSMVASQVTRQAIDDAAMGSRFVPHPDLQAVASAAIQRLQSSGMSSSTFSPVLVNPHPVLSGANPPTRGQWHDSVESNYKPTSPGEGPPGNRTPPPLGAQHNGTSEFHLFPSLIHSVESDLHLPTSVSHQVSTTLHVAGSQVHISPSFSHQVGSSVHTGISLTHWSSSKRHLSPSTTHENASELHDPLSNTHNPLSDYHFFTSSTHSPSSDAHHPPSTSHTSTSESHDIGSDLHDPESETHRFSSDVHDAESVTHETDSDLHFEGSESHHASSSTHIGATVTHSISSVAHQLASSSHYGTSTQHSPPSTSHSLASGLGYGSGDIFRDWNSAKGGGCSWALYGMVVGSSRILPESTEDNGGIRVIDSTYPSGADGVGYPSPQQTEDGRVRVRYEYRAEAAVVMFQDPANCQSPLYATPFQWETPVYDGACGSYWAAKTAVNIRVLDAEDRSSYAVDPQRGDNLGNDNNDRDDWGIDIGQLIGTQHPTSSFRLAGSSDTFFEKITLIPELVDQVPSVIPYNVANNIPAAIFAVEFDLVLGDGEPTEDSGGNNYDIEIQLGFGSNLNSYFEPYEPVGNCLSYTPEFRDELQSTWVFSTDHPRHDRIEDFQLWRRVYVQRCVTRKSGAELLLSVNAGEDEIRVIEPLASAQFADESYQVVIPQWEVGQEIRVFDIDDPVGEIVTIVQVTPSTPLSFNSPMNYTTTLRVSPELTKSYIQGYRSGDLNGGGGFFPPRGGGAVVPVAAENSYWEDAFASPTAMPLIEESLEPLFVDVADVTGSDEAIEIPYNFSFRAMNDLSMLEAGNRAKLNSSVDSRLKAWAPNYDFLSVEGSRRIALISGGWISQWRNLWFRHLAGYGLNTNEFPVAFAMVCVPVVRSRADPIHGGWDPNIDVGGQSDTRIAEMCAHEVGHAMLQAHCDGMNGAPDHLIGQNIAAAGHCVMHIAAGSFWWGDAWIDGISSYSVTPGLVREAANVEAYNVRANALDW